MKNKAWLKRRGYADEVVNVIGGVPEGRVMRYDLYTAYDQPAEFLGSILFDANGYWIYHGDVLTVEEQEQIGKFIQYNMEFFQNS